MKGCVYFYVHVQLRIQAMGSKGTQAWDCSWVSIKLEATPRAVSPEAAQRAYYRLGTLRDSLSHTAQACKAD